MSTRELTEWVNRAYGPDALLKLQRNPAWSTPAKNWSPGTPPPVQDSRVRLGRSWTNEFDFGHEPRASQRSASSMAIGCPQARFRPAIRNRAGAPFRGQNAPFLPRRNNNASLSCGRVRCDWTFRAFRGKEREHGQRDHHSSYPNHNRHCHRPAFSRDLKWHFIRSERTTSHTRAQHDAEALEMGTVEGESQ